ncbi:hypothetical protein JCM33374_g2418 [Metschnikowia sp. JCM 33374]|nr:hypothetical protein JCM33374_g2418 [Metschnikowia sp. JCM 33374]
MAPGVPSLFHISQAVCIKQAPHITDVGDTPYHLISPILKRLNAKQLAHLEENSPSVMPHSDECWGALIEKDFPDRPYNPSKLRLLACGEQAQMPRKALYKQYSGEREAFLATSADRLRKMTEKLRKEKSKNSITTVQGVLADPTIRRRVPRSFSSKSYNTSKPRPRSILGKAMRDVSHRSLMFGGGPKPYDPYKAFQAQNKPQARTNGALSPGSGGSRLRSPSKPQNHLPSNLGASVKRDIPAGARSATSYFPSMGPNKDSTVRLQTGDPQSVQSPQSTQSPQNPQSPQNSQSLQNPLSPQKPQSPLTSVASPTSNQVNLESPGKPKPGEPSQGAESASIPPHMRKRRPPPSIFLNRRKTPRLGTTKSPAGPGTKKNNREEKAEAKPEDHRPVKAIKSSIFN